MLPNKKQIQRAFSQAATTYDQAACLQKTVADHLLRYLPELDIEVLCDVGSGTGYCLNPLKIHYSQALCCSLDLSATMLKQQTVETVKLQGDFDALPFKNNAVDLLFSNLAFQWSCHLSNTLKECHRIIEPQGYLLFSSLTVGTLQELPTRHVFLTGDQIQQITEQYFTEVHCVSETHVLYFNSILEVLHSLKKVGAHCGVQQNAGLTGKGFLEKLAQPYPKVNGQFPLTYEVIYVLGRKR